MGPISLHWDLDWLRGSGAWALRLPFSVSWKPVDTGSGTPYWPARHWNEAIWTLVRRAAPVKTKSTKPSCPHQNHPVQLCNWKKGCSLWTGRDRFPGSIARFKSKLQESTQSAVFVLAWETLEDCVRLKVGYLQVTWIFSQYAAVWQHCLKQWFFCPSGQRPLSEPWIPSPLCSHGWYWVASWANEWRVIPGRKPVWQASR